MIVKFEKKDKWMCVFLTGSIYEEEAESIRDAVSRHIDKREISFLLDFSDVEFICDAGIAVLISIQQRAVKKGGRTVITGLSEHMRNRFELNRLDRLFEIR